MEEIKDPKLWLAFEKYCEWSALPRHFAKLTLPELEERGFSGELIELLGIKDKASFCEKFNVTRSTLASWDKHPKFHEKIKASWKSWGKKLTPGVLGRFYEKLMMEGDPGRMKIWMQTIEEEGKDENAVNVNIGIENIRKSMQEDEGKNAAQTPPTDPK